MAQEVHPKDEQVPTPPLSQEVTEASTNETIAQTDFQEQWREEFPYPWDEDEIITRRDTLRFLLAGSGALFLATGALAIIGNLPKGENVQAVPIAKVGELAENDRRYFDIPYIYGQCIYILFTSKR